MTLLWPAKHTTEPLVKCNKTQYWLCIMDVVLYPCWSIRCDTSCVG